MLAQLRALAKSPIVIALLTLLMASFLLWGIRDVFRYTGSSDAVVTAGPRTIGAARFQQMFQDELKAYGQQTGQTITAQEALHANLDRQIADAVASDESFAELIRRTGVRPSDKLIVEEIRKAPRFFNPVSGVFDRDAYEQFVHQLGMSDAEFERLLRDEQAQAQFVSGLTAGLRAPLLFDALVAASEGEGRTFSYFVLPQSAVAAAARPTDAQLNAFIEENASRLRRPEMRVLTVVRFSEADIMASLTPTPAELQKRFDFEKDALSTPEKRTLVQIPVKTTADGAKVAAELKAGMAPAAAARTVGAQPIGYADQPKSAIADRKLADAAFSAPAGAVLGPLQGDLGLAVLKVLAAVPGHTATLDDVRARIEAEVRKSDADAKVDQEVKTYEDARSGGADLAAAAAKAGAVATTLAPMTAQGNNALGQPVPIAPKLLQAAAGLTAGGDSDVVDLGQGDYGAVRVDKVLPPAVPPLDQIRPQLTTFWMVRDVQTRLAARANDLANQIRAGKPIQAVAQSAGATVQQGVDVVRTATGPAYSQDLLGAIFQAKPGQVVLGPDAKTQAAVVAKVEAVVPAGGQAAAQLAANQRLNMRRSLTQDLGQGVRTAARAIVKPHVDYRRAHQAVGGDAAQ